MTAGGLSGRGRGRSDAALQWLGGCPAIAAGCELLQARAASTERGPSTGRVPRREGPPSLRLISQCAASLAKANGISSESTTPHAGTFCHAAPAGGCGPGTPLDGGLRPDFSPSPSHFVPCTKLYTDWYVATPILDPSPEPAVLLWRICLSCSSATPAGAWETATNRAVLIRA